MLCDTESTGGDTIDDMYVPGRALAYIRVWINRVELPNLLVVS